MLVCGSHSSVFVREKCWYVVVIALFVREKISALQTQSYDYHIPTFLSYKQSYDYVREKCWYVVVIVLSL
jgi:hypothetical protein